jgi:hypothetical protein
MPPQTNNRNVWVVVVALRITEKTERRVCIKLCQNVGKTCTETYDMIKMAFGEDSVSRTQVFEWFRCFKEKRTSVESDGKFEE